MKQKKEGNSEIKRLQGFNEIVDRHRQQKNLIKTALSNVDTAKSNKIIFDDHVEEATEHTNGYDNETKTKTSKRLLESDDEESDVEINFEEKKQFSGAKGQKLLNLKARYNNDERFTLDERFIEEDESENKDEEINQNENGMDVDDIEAEKEKELAILNGILQKDVRPEKPKTKKNEQQKMIRFDPALPEHSKFIVTESSENKEKKKKKKEKKLEKTDETKIDNPLPEVSKEIFYKVDENLKDALQSKESFSLLSAFGTADDKNDREEENEEESEEIKKQKLVGPNPFRYDSSDDEEGETTKKSENDDNQEKTTVDTNVNIKLWSEPFFFQENDYRLQEGLDFIKRISEKNQDDDFGKVRRNLKEIIKSKVRNNKKKDKMFKRKLGGNKRRKMIRMKKALKR